ncbi:MAG: hypothetical protein AB7G06_08190 [Bdellovibrionales bacterium]
MSAEPIDDRKPQPPNADQDPGESFRDWAARKGREKEARRQQAALFYAARADGRANKAHWREISLALKQKAGKPVPFRREKPRYDIKGLKMG